tara:strand:- start:2230 stop:2418 length:189 start_codon:yes stop_codon:yes gene_type:complete
MFDENEEQMKVELDDIGFGAGMSDENIEKFIKNVLERHQENPFKSHDEYYAYVDGIAQKWTD